MTNPLTSLLVVGAGSIGERHIRCFQATGRAVVSICEVNKTVRRQVADRYGIDRSFEDLATALSAPHDAVVIATPAQLHVSQAQQACEAGLHALIEKPLSTAFDGIDRLQETVTSKGLIAAVAYVYRAHPALAAMKRALDQHRFGKPLQLAVMAGQNFPHYRPAYRDTYYVDHARGGGAIQDALTHVINAAEWLVGPLTRLVADAEHLRIEGVEVEDTVHVIARHDTVLASYSLNQHQAPNECTITVNCENGTARFETHHSRWRWKADPEENWSEERFDDLERDSLFTTQANWFLDAIGGQADPLCAMDEGIQTLRCNLAVLDSVEQGSWQVIDS